VLEQMNIYQAVYETKKHFW